MKRRLALLLLCLLPLPLLAEEETPAAAPKVRLKTNHGEIVLELDPVKAPITTANFLRYVGEKHYDGTVFHRVIDQFMIQGGGFAQEGGKLTEKPTSGEGIRNESDNGLKNTRGTIAMARTADPHSARAQFFINVSDNPALDYPSNGGYAVFGKVVEGMETVEKIKAARTGESPLVMRHPQTGEPIEMPARDVPAEAVIIESATIVE